MALDPGCFAPGFEGRLQDMMDYCRDMEPVEADKPVKVRQFLRVRYEAQKTRKRVFSVIVIERFDA